MLRFHQPLVEEGRAVLTDGDETTGQSLVIGSETDEFGELSLHLIQLVVDGLAFILQFLRFTVLQQLIDFLQLGYAGGFALGCLARFFVSRLVIDSLHAIHNSRHPGYYDVITGNKWFDAPIKRHHLRIRTVGDVRRAGLLKASFQQAAVSPTQGIAKTG
jgi:hypothetical protein